MADAEKKTKREKLLEKEEKKREKRIMKEKNKQYDGGFTARCVALRSAASRLRPRRRGHDRRRGGRGVLHCFA